MPSYKRLLIASAKGGVGKSTTALGLAAAFAEMGKKTLLADLDNVSRSLDLMSGTADKSICDFGDVISGGDFSPVVPYAHLPNLSLIAACNSSYADYLSENSGETVHMLTRRAVERISELTSYDILICDTGGGIDTAKAVCDIFDMVLIVSEQGQTSVRAADYAASELISSGAKCMRLVICSFDIASVRRERRAGVIEIIDASAVRCIGVVPFDKKIQKAQDGGILVPRKSASSLAYMNIAKRISGGDVPLFFGMTSYRRKIRRAL